MAAAQVAVNTEENIRTTAQTKRIRPSEFFLDYDRLRSGFVTGQKVTSLLYTILRSHILVDLCLITFIILNFYEISLVQRNFDLFCF